MISTEARRVTGTHAMISANRIATSIGIGERQVRRHIQKLQELGWLKVSDRGGRHGDRAEAHVYVLQSPGQKDDE